MILKIKPAMACGLLLGSVFSTVSAQQTTQISHVVTAPAVANGATMSASGIPETHSTSPEYMADKWYRDSAERNAIFREIYLLAENVIKQKIATQGLKPHQWGVVLDIDESVLDNSLWDYQHDIQGNPQNWNDFAAEAMSVPTPGVKQFLMDIHKMGGYINLISNRPIFLQAETIKNLRKEGISYDQLLLDATNQGTSFVDKNARFTAVIQGKSPSQLPPQQIVAWFGDNIQDFPKLLQANMIKQDPNGDAYNPFGVTFFALPNPMYGSWEANKFN